jgi:nucleotide-binding universal stress UspA family protein
LHVYPPSLDRGLVSAFEIEPEDLDAAFARMVLSAAVERFAAKGIVVSTLVLVGHRTEVICDHASSHGFDLILIGSAGASRTGLGLAEAVRRRARMPVEAVA